jgi:hypothetical protein
VRSLTREPDEKTQDHSYRYHRAQESFTSALAKCPLLAEDQTEFNSFFIRDAKKRVPLPNIKQAANFASCSPDTRKNADEGALESHLSPRENGRMVQAHGQSRKLGESLDKKINN